MGEWDSITVLTVPLGDVRDVLLDCGLSPALVDKLRVGDIIAATSGAVESAPSDDDKLPGMELVVFLCI